MKRLRFPWAALLLTAALWCLGAAAQDGKPSQPTVTFTKEFPGSNPAYYSITVGENGEATYRTAPEEQPVVFQLSQEAAQQIFSLVQKLNGLKGANFESGRKVAQMGKKTFAFENGSERAEVSYNHSENADALALTILFERLSQTQQHRDRLEYLLRFDRLGVVKELLQLERDLDQGRLLDPSLLLPILEKLRANKALVNVAHDRASGIIAKVESTGK